MGRPAKYLTEDDRKKGTLEMKRRRLKTTVCLSLGKAFSTWAEVKRATNSTSDAALALILLDW